LQRGVTDELARLEANLAPMDDLSELTAAGLLSLYLFVAISVADWLLVAPSVALLALAGWLRLRGTSGSDPGYDRA
jgi:hypothetical protein